MWELHTMSLKELKISYIDAVSFDSLEQECHINVLRAGYENQDEQEIWIDCSNQMYITQLKNSEYFILTEVLVSKHERNKDYVLAVKGRLENNGLTIRKKKPVYTEEEKKARAERAKNNFSK